MSISIDRLHMQVSIPRRLQMLQPIAGAVEDSARHHIGPALADIERTRGLGRGVHRIRQLRVRICISARDIKAAKLPSTWAEAFWRALTLAVEQGGSGIVSAESRAAWVAGFIGRLADGGSSDAWAYAEFHDVRALPSGAAIVRLLEAMPGDAFATLRVIHERLLLDRVLTTLDDGQADRLLGLLDRVERRSMVTLSVDDLEYIARAIVDTSRLLSSRTPIASPARAIAIHVAGARPSTGGASSPAGILNLLSVLDALCALQRIAAPDDVVVFVARALATLTQRDAHVAEVLLSLRLPQGFTDLPAARLAEARSLVPAIDAVRGAVTSAGADAAKRLVGVWIDSDVAGLWLLVPTVKRLDWARRIQRTTLWDVDGPRALTYVLAGTALALLNKSLEPSSLEASVTSFAGWFGQPDGAGFARWLDRTSTEGRLELLSALAGEQDADVAAAAEQSASTFAQLGRTLVRQFARDLRGFGRASDRFIVERCIQSPGRLLIEERRIAVSLQPNPLWVALHVSAADAPIESVDWLGGRRVEFELGGL